MVILPLIRKQLMITGSAIFVFPLLASAAAPLWDITPSTSLPQEVGKDERVTIKYTVTNQSSKPHTLVMKDVQGVTVTPASCALSKGQSCEMTLVIDGAKLGPNGITGGPIVCQQGNNNQCYQASSSNQLKISPKAPPAPTSTSSKTQLEGSIASQISKQADFDEAYYLAQNVDVAAAVHAGAFSLGWAHYDAYGRTEGRPARNVNTSPSTPSSTPASTSTSTASTSTPEPTPISPTTQPSSAMSAGDTLKELKALIEDLEIEIEDGASSKPHSLTNTLLQFDPIIGEWHPHYEHELPGGQTALAKDAPHAALIWLKRLVNSIEGYMISVKNPTNSESARSNISRSLQSQIDKAASILNAISPKTTTTAGQGGGGTPVGTQQAIDDATRRAMQTSTPSPAATPTPAPAKLCYKVGTETMCH